MLLSRDRTVSLRGARAFSAMLAAVGVILASVVLAIDDAALEIERVDGAGWHAEGVVARIDASNASMRLQATIARLWLDTPAQEVLGARIDCGRARVSGDVIECDQATVSARLPVLGAQSMRGRIEYARKTGALAIALDGLALAQGRAGVELTLQDTGWRAAIRLKDAPIEVLLDVARKFGTPVPAVTATGIATLSLDAQGAGATVARAHIDGTVANLTANNEAGSLATDKLTVAVKGSAARRAGDWNFQVSVRSGLGQAYAQPVFVDFGAHAVVVDASGTWRDASRVLALDRFTVDHRDVARAEGAATLALREAQPLRSLALKLERLTFPGAYESYLQPLLLDTDFKALTTAGTLAGEVRVEGAEPQQLDLRFDGLSFDDGARNFVVSGLRGEWHWRARTVGGSDNDTDVQTLRVPPSVVRWQNAALLRLGVGAGELSFETAGHQFRLLRPSSVPLLDGAIDVDSLRIRNLGLPTVAFIVDATIRPISAAQLCEAFGWPQFGGRVGGVISKLRMREGVITLGTTLEAQVFDGNVMISDLRLEQPFGQRSKFSSNIKLRNLDLELVTGAFSFGRITGRLSGDIDGLQLFNWTPVAFEASLYTPADDRSRHRISQRAVETIGSIGGGGAGVAAALSSGFLRFFDDFNYERLGITCRLQNEVCSMDGVAAAPNGGYYLVKGRGVPRIDVIGSSHRVDWPRLVQQLIAATKSSGPVVD